MVMHKEKTISLGTLRLFLVLLSFPLLLALLFSFFFNAEGSHNKTIVFLFGSVSMPFFPQYLVPWHICMLLYLYCLLFGNYVKDESPKENTLWMILRDTGINGNLATVKFKLRLSRGIFPSVKGLVSQL